MLILTYFTARSNFATSTKWENATMMDTLEIIASCDLEFVFLCKLNVQIKESWSTQLFAVESEMN